MTSGVRNTLIAANAVALLITSLAQATEPQTALKRNPFERPDAEVLITSAAGLNEIPSAGREPDLRAVLVAGSKSVVDFGGVIMQIGESINGYRLLSVEEDKAVFRRDDTEVAFWLYAPEIVNDDE